MFGLLHRTTRTHTGMGMGVLSRHHTTACVERCGLGVPLKYTRALALPQIIMMVATHYPCNKFLQEEYTRDGYGKDYYSMGDYNNKVLPVTL